MPATEAYQNPLTHYRIIDWEPFICSVRFETNEYLIYTISDFNFYINAWSRKT